MKRIILVLPLILNSGLMAMRGPLKTVLRHYYYLECAPAHCARCPQKCTMPTQCSTCPTGFVREQIIKNKELRIEHNLLKDVFETAVTVAHQHFPEQTWPTKPEFKKTLTTPIIPRSCFRACFIALCRKNTSLKIANDHLTQEIKKLLVRIYSQNCKNQGI